MTTNPIHRRKIRFYFDMSQGYPSLLGLANFSLISTQLLPVNTTWGQLPGSHPTLPRWNDRAYPMVKLISLAAFKT
jgi:hypothetical protein